ncbi:hypothetical protein AcW1_003759 [Taiwanofungus camphoratus]|nr:hypothetical protein AcW1_003759 [Antrodia cinnamomea]
MPTMKVYPTRQLGTNGPIVSAIGLGVMGMGAFYGKGDEEKAFATLTRAADRGVTFWDTADIYGTNEALLGRWFAETGRRSEIFLATKFGSIDTTPGVADKYKPNSKPSYIRRQVENSLKTMGTDWIDLYYQHRVDPEVPTEVVMQTLLPYIQSGKIKYVGLSECSVDVLRRAKAVPGVGERVIACQMEFSPFALQIESSGFVAAARELGVAIVAYSPLGRGLITGKQVRFAYLPSVRLTNAFRYKSRKDFDADDIRQMLPQFSDENFPKNLVLVEKFRAVANRYGMTTGQLALAWIIQAYPDFVPIPGSRTVERLEENAKAAEITISAEDLKAIRAAIDSTGVYGDRYPEQFVALANTDCIPLDEWKEE